MLYFCVLPLVLNLDGAHKHTNELRKAVQEIFNAKFCEYFYAAYNVLFKYNYAASKIMSHNIGHGLDVGNKIKIIEYFVLIGAATGLPKVLYKNVLDGEFEVVGLPDGIPYKKPSAYGRLNLEAILAATENIRFLSEL